MMKRIVPTTLGLLLAVWSFGAIAAYAKLPTAPSTAVVAQVRAAISPATYTDDGPGGD